VPSQDDVLKDNKRCYDNILSECGISDPLQIYSGWLDMNTIMVCSFGHQFVFCHEFARNISTKIAHHWLQSLLLLSYGPELALHRQIENLKKTCINFWPCSVRTISSFCQTIIFFGAISIHCGGHHSVSVMVNTLLPSQDDVLKDNKRCNDNILSECGISDPLQIYSGWLDHWWTWSWYAVLTINFFGQT
jgi:hypothetical protein